MCCYVHFDFTSQFTLRKGFLRQHTYELFWREGVALACSYSEGKMQTHARFISVTLVKMGHWAATGWVQCLSSSQHRITTAVKRTRSPRMRPTFSTLGYHLSRKLSRITFLLERSQSPEIYVSSRWCFLTHLQVLRKMKVTMFSRETSEHILYNCQAPQLGPP